MSQIPFEDRTSETPEQAADRQLIGPAMLLANTAYGIAKGNTVATLRILSAALGVALARADVPVEAITETVRQHRDNAKAAFDEQSQSFKKVADA